METPTQPSNKVAIIRNLYLYLVSFVALMMVVFSTADIVNTALKIFVFKNADNYYYYAPKIQCAQMKTPDNKQMSAEECAKEEDRMQKEQEQNRKAQRENSLVRDISFIFVGIPLFMYHWRIIRRKE